MLTCCTQARQVVEKRPNGDGQAPFSPPAGRNASPLWVAHQPPTADGASRKARRLKIRLPPPVLELINNKTPEAQTQPASVTMGMGHGRCPLKPGTSAHGFRRFCRRGGKATVGVRRGLEGRCPPFRGWAPQTAGQRRPMDEVRLQGISSPPFRTKSLAASCRPNPVNERRPHADDRARSSELGNIMVKIAVWCGTTQCR